MTAAIKDMKGTDPIDQAAERWLAATELGNDRAAAALLIRAMRPPKNFAREPLALPEPGSGDAAKVMRLLKIGQTPTPAAIEHLVVPAPGPKRLSPSKQAKQARQQQLKQRAFAAIADVETAGELLAAAAADYWREHEVGPHWSQALDAPQVAKWWTEMTGLRFAGTEYRQRLFRGAKKVGWVAFNTSERSLCPGRLFYSRRLGETVSQTRHQNIGFFTAVCIEIHRTTTGRSPDWSQIAASATDQHGIPLFADAHDAAAQCQWMSTNGWILMQDNQLHPGPKAEKEACRRAERAQSAETTTTE